MHASKKPQSNTDCVGVVTSAAAAQAARQVQLQFAEGPRVDAVTGGPAPKRRKADPEDEQGTLL